MQEEETRELARALVECERVKELARWLNKLSQADFQKVESIFLEASRNPKPEAKHGQRSGKNNP